MRVGINQAWKNGTPKEPRHELKTWPDPFDAVLSGHKAHEIRSTVDRDFEVGDWIRLREWNPSSPGAGYTGRTADVLVTYRTRAGTFGLPPKVTVLSVKKLEVSPGEIAVVADQMFQSRIGQALNQLQTEREALRRELDRERNRKLTKREAAGLLYSAFTFRELFLIGLLAGATIAAAIRLCAL